MDNAITQLLDQWREGDASARDRLAASLYPELHRLAGRLFQRERSDHTLQPTALVNEAWLRLSQNALLQATDRNRLLAIGAHLMREILIDHARRHTSAKRDGGERVTLSLLADTGDAPEADLIALHEALEKLEAISPAYARVVELRYFGGLSIEETAQAMELSPATVKLHWQAARVWLFDALKA